MAAATMEIFPMTINRENWHSFYNSVDMMKKIKNVTGIYYKIPELHMDH